MAPALPTARKQRPAYRPRLAEPGRCFEADAGRAVTVLRLSAPYTFSVAPPAADPTNSSSPSSAKAALMAACVV